MWRDSFRLALRKRVAIAVTLALLLAIALTFVTGFVAAAFDLNRFAYHKYAAYAAIALVLVHVAVHWRSMTAQVRRWLLSGASASHAAATRASGPRLSRRALLLPGLSLAAGAGPGHMATGGASPLVGLRDGDDLGLIYHRWSTPSYAGMLAKSVRITPQPPLYKELPDAQVVRLPEPPPPSGFPLEVALAQRRSIREYAARRLTVAELGRLLHRAAGITDRRDPTLAFRAVPSSGALFPIELYPVVFGVDGLAPGVYHYAVVWHALELVQAGDFRQDVFHAAVSQEMVQRASLVLVLTGIFSRVQFKCCWRLATWARTCIWRPLRSGSRRAASVRSSTTSSIDSWAWTGATKRRSTCWRWAPDLRRDAVVDQPHPTR
jgi:hypothetical protein